MSGGRMSGGRILAIETSCDETAVAVVERGRRIHADVVASQVALHARTGEIICPALSARQRRIAPDSNRVNSPSS